MASSDRAAVKTYISETEKAKWQSHADELDMSLSEYVRNMVQAGKRNFDLEPVKTSSTDTNPGGQPLETRVRNTFQDHEYVSWNELEQIHETADTDSLNRILQELQSENTIGYDGPSGGYTLIDDE